MPLCYFIQAYREASKKLKLEESVPTDALSGGSYIANDKFGFHTSTTKVLKGIINVKEWKPLILALARLLEAQPIVLMLNG